MSSEHIFSLVEDIQNETTGAFTVYLMKMLCSDVFGHGKNAVIMNCHSAVQAFELVRVIT
jgi:hypothetical protein